MAPPTPAIPAFTDGQIVSQGSLNALGANETNLYSYLMGGFRTRKPICVLRVTSSTLSVPNNTQFFVPWQSEDVDTDAMFNPSIDDRLTIQTAGIYRLEFTGAIKSGTGGKVFARILVNGTSEQIDAVTAESAELAGGISVSCSAVVPLTAGSVVRYAIRQTSGAAQTIDNEFGGTRASAEFLSPTGNA